MSFMKGFILFKMDLRTRHMFLLPIIFTESNQFISVVLNRNAATHQTAIERCQGFRQLFHFNDVSVNFHLEVPPNSEITNDGFRETKKDCLSKTSFQVAAAIKNLLEKTCGKCTVTSFNALNCQQGNLQTHHYQYAEAKG